MGLLVRKRSKAAAVLAPFAASALMPAAGCSEDPPEPSTIGGDGTASESPAQSFADTTVSDEEQAAVDAATEAYDDWYEVVARLGKAPQDYIRRPNFGHRH